MFCSKCGSVMAEGAAFCTNCGQAFSAAVARTPMLPVPVAVAAAGGTAVPAYPGYAVVPRVEYAGFWLRFLAYIIDNVVIGTAAVMILIPLIFLTGLGAFLSKIFADQDIDDMGAFMLVGIVFLLETISLVVTWLYHAWMESSEWQATVGKRVLGLVVTDAAGQRISFGPRHRQALQQNYHQHGPSGHRLHHGRLHRKKAGPARHDRRMPGPAAQQLKN